MTINIFYKGKLLESIRKEKGWVIALSIMNHANDFSTIDLDELQFKDTCIRLSRDLPNGSTIEFVIREIADELAALYQGFENLSVSWNEIRIIAEI